MVKGCLCGGVSLKKIDEKKKILNGLKLHPWNNLNVYKN